MRGPEQGLAPNLPVSGIGQQRVNEPSWSLRPGNPQIPGMDGVPHISSARSESYLTLQLNVELSRPSQPRYKTRDNRLLLDQFTGLLSLQAMVAQNLVFF